ncbi:hypothetical protein BUALT_Bualt03G0204900 [Buddleja alternifolia]|uniref:Transposase-associated domain-containing protein n=1 Tax=Buddleja alternifolia TaxID=168488 RepID=A0AAV6XWV0_9LAMI|nr:hypothetical protein BUALT_Bualt03G0204900 [Buddleja alternifolia]
MLWAGVLGQNSKGDVRFCFYGHLGARSNTFGKLYMLFHGLELCASRGYKQDEDFWKALASIAMDKSWIDEKDRFNVVYITGVESFLKFSRENTLCFDGKILCPCNDCRNTKRKNLLEVKRDLHLKGFYVYYKEWTHHGKSTIPRSFSSRPSNHNNDHAQNENSGDLDDNDTEIMDELLEMIGEMRDADLPEQSSESNIEDFERLMSDVRRELYHGCKKYSLVSFIVKLLQIKVVNKMTDKTMNMILELIKDILPVGEIVPPSLYWARKLLSGIGLGYKKIEVLWYFPLKPRLQRLFMSSKTASYMRWHAEKCIDIEGSLSHPADSPTWKDFDIQNPSFSANPRNVRLGLATDGFNPFGNMSNSYSMWHVILIPYNMPLYKCMKDEFFMMPLLIPGPRAPEKDIDVYLRPLIEELKELWNGVETYDASGKESFQMRAAIMWTINGFPALSNLLGWTTKGYGACPCCFYETDSKRIRSKICYMGHRRYLDSDHPYRKSKLFDGKPETRSKPRQWTGEELLSNLNNLEHRFNKLGKHPSKRKRKRSDGKLLETEFPKGFKKPLRFANHLANGIGIVVSSFDWIPLQKWQVLCDHYETEKFKEKQSDVDNFANTHMKNGIFINEKAAKVHAGMENKRNQVKDSGGSPVLEREIVRQSLGKRPGYEKGLGYGVVPSKCTKRTTCESSQIEALKEKLSSAEEELQDATSRIKSQV